MELDSLQNSGDFTDNSAVHTDRMDNTTKLQDFTDNSAVHTDRMDNTTKLQGLAPETKKSCVMAACPNSNISHGT
jgi:hypothetical protein